MGTGRVQSFDDWIDYFRFWVEDIGLDARITADYVFEAKYGDLHTGAIEFGDYRGERKWETVLEVPDQRVRDALLHLITYQGDTEFASVEQQRHLVATAPSDYDLQSLVRIMREEMRHGWQMCHVLVTHFGSSGRVEAQKLLERRAFKNNRLLGSFNVPVHDWLDFFTYTDFVDRDGKFQLTMLSYSGFAPVAQSMVPMLREESFHLGTGQDGIKRVVKAGVLPLSVVQKFINKWVPVSYDLFGVDRSSSAHWFYVWGLKGRYDEPQAKQEADLEHMNEHSRRLYHLECQKLIEQINKNIPAGQKPLYVPDLKFNRHIGEFANQPYSVAGELLSPGEHEEHVREMLPQPEDVKLVNEIQASEPNWIAPKGSMQ